MRTDLSGNPSFRDLVGRVSRSTLGAYEHQDLPFQKLAEFPNIARIPLNRAMFALQNTPSQPKNLGGIAVTSVEPSWETTNFDFSLSMYENEKQLAGLLEYKTDLFNTTTITQMIENFQTLLESLVANPNQRLGELPALRRTELPQPTQEKAAYVAPQKEIERILADVWQEVLHLEKVGIHDNFFDLGGHSLLIIQVYAKLKDIFNGQISIIDLFQYPTICAITEFLSQQPEPKPRVLGEIRESANRQKEAIRQQQKLLKFRRRTNG
jgi:acyl carrier protein